MTKKESPTWQGEAKGKKARENLQVNNTANTTRCQSAAAQRQRILEHLKHSTLTTLQAREQLDIMHPGMRVCELRKIGLPIETEWSWEYSAGGSRHRIARYSLEAQEGEK
jgi:hypothetical protein